MGTAPYFNLPESYSHVILCERGIRNNKLLGAFWHLVPINQAFWTKPDTEFIIYEFELVGINFYLDFSKLEGKVLLEPQNFIFRKKFSVRFSNSFHIIMRISTPVSIVSFQRIEVFVVSAR